MCLDNKENPIQRCYYGACHKSNIFKCDCPLCHNDHVVTNGIGQDGSLDTAMVCGSNHQSYENRCVLTRDSCKLETRIKELYKGKCSKWKHNVFFSSVGYQHNIIFIVSRKQFRVDILLTSSPCKQNLFQIMFIHLLITGSALQIATHFADFADTSKKNNNKQKPLINYGVKTLKHEQLGAFLKFSKWKNIYI